MFSRTVSDLLEDNLVNLFRNRNLDIYSYDTLGIPILFPPLLLDIIISLQNTPNAALWNIIIYMNYAPDSYLNLWRFSNPKGTRIPSCICLKKNAMATAKMFISYPFNKFKNAMVFSSQCQSISTSMSRKFWFRPFSVWCFQVAEPKI